MEAVVLPVVYASSVHCYMSAIVVDPSEGIPSCQTIAAVFIERAIYRNLSLT